MESVWDLTRGLFHRRDPRVRDYIMQSSCGPVMLAMLGYLVLILYGPRFMKNRRTPPLKLALTIYNVGQVCLSYYMMREFWLSKPAARLCSPIEANDSPKSLRLTNACWLFHVSKIVDFLDTVFLVLRKDNKRLTYLHVYHHGSMAFGFWLCTLFVPGGSSWIAGVMNSFVHCVMYSYYLLASLGPRVRPYLWWKRYLTQLQLIQFALIVVMAWMVQMPSMRCGMPFWTCAMSMVYLVVLSILFLNFYKQSYINQITPTSSPCSTPGDPPVGGALPGGNPTEPARGAPPEDRPDPAPATPTLAKHSVETSPPDRVGTLSHFMRAMMSHGFGCFIKED